MEDKNELIETAEALKALAQNEDAAVEMVRVGLDIKEEDYSKIRQTITEFVSDYQKKDDATTDKQWLVQSFNRYPKLWKDANDIEQTAEAIVSTVYAYEKNRQELEDHLAAGKQRGSWISKKLEQGAAFSGVQQVNRYAAHLDEAISNANRQMADTIRTMNGEINQNPNLDGLIAEQHHANTFNLDAAQKEQPFYAETQKSTGKNSVDIVVRDADGKIAQKYQSKYGKDTEHTEQYFKDGKYQGQQKLVPKGQGKDIGKAHEKIELSDYKSKKKESIESKPLSKEEAKAMQEKAQREGKADEYSWKDYNTRVLAKSIGKKASMAALFAIGFQGARILGRRIWNWATGKENQSVAEDVQEFAKSSLEAGVSAGLTVAASGALTIAARSGWLGKVLINTPAGRIAAAACVGVENIKVLYKFSKGEISGQEAIDQAGRATCSVVGGLVGSTKGAALGAAVGTVLGPIGAAIGGLTGGVVGGIAGSAFGEAVYNGGKKIVSTVVGELKAAGSVIVNSARAVGGALSSVLPWHW